MPNKRPSPTTPDQRGAGDELHQGVKRGERMTTATGTPLGDGQNSLKVGDRGPTLLEDFAFRDKMFHFDHERIPERVVHARGYSAHATLECLDAIPDLTRASPCPAKGK
jgi:catalase